MRSSFRSNLRIQFLGCVQAESVTDGAECSKKVVNGRRVAGSLRSLVNARDLPLEYCMKHYLYLFLRMAIRQCYGRRRAVQMDNLKGLLGLGGWIESQMHGYRSSAEQTKGLIKGFSAGSTMWRGGRGIELLRESMQKNVLVVAQWIGRGRDGLIP